MIIFKFLRKRHRPTIISKPILYAFFCWDKILINGFLKIHMSLFKININSYSIKVILS